jgi:hypothetical protein
MVRYSPRSRRTCRSLAAAVALAAALGSGCSGRELPDTVSGKVTLQGKPVSGQVVFLSGDGKEFVAFTGGPDGSYTITNAPKGEVTVLIKGLGQTGQTASSRPPPVGPKPVAGGVAPPARYAEPNELKLVVVGGQQVQDFDLTP